MASQKHAAILGWRIAADKGVFCTTRGLARSVRVVATTYTAEPAKLFHTPPLTDELGLESVTDESETTQRITVDPFPSSRRHDDAECPDAELVAPQARSPDHHRQLGSLPVRALHLLLAARWNF
jgi:hypothetical protein